MRSLSMIVLVTWMTGGCDASSPPTGDTGRPDADTIDASVTDAPAFDAAAFDAADDTAAVDGALDRDSAGSDAGPGASLVFANDWPAIGATSAAVLGATGATPWEIRVGSAPSSLTVVDALAEGIAAGCPSTNALRTDLVYVGGAIQNMQTDEVGMLPGSGAWPIPAVGESVYYRVYHRFHYPSGTDPAALGNNNHSLENRGGGMTNWSWTFHTSPEGFSPRFQVWTGGANTRFVLGGATPIHLARDAWFRFEFNLRRTAVDAREHQIRIYDASGTLLYDESDFFDEFRPAVSLAGFSERFSDPTSLDAWQLGTNGPHVTGATQGAAPAWYWAAAAVSTTGWCGAYVPGESP